MELANLKLPPLNANLMGASKGASDYFDNDLSTAMLFGLLGHAFLINIQRDIALSGPFVWKEERFYELLLGLGIERVGEYELTGEPGDAEQLRAEREFAGNLERKASEAERARVEHELKNQLEVGSLVTLDFLEHQLIAGYDEQGFLLLQPWGGMASSEVKALTFGSWQECLAKEGWAHFTVLSRSPSRRPLLKAADDALAFAADFFTELSEIVPGSEESCARLSEIYRELSGLLSRVGARGG